MFLCDAAGNQDATDIVQVFSYNLASQKSNRSSEIHYARKKWKYLAFMWGTLGDGRLRLHPVVQTIWRFAFPQVGLGRSHGRPLLRAILATFAIC